MRFDRRCNTATAAAAAAVPTAIAGMSGPLEYEAGGEVATAAYDEQLTPSRADMAKLAGQLRAEQRSAAAADAADAAAEECGAGGSFAHGVDPGRDITPAKAFIHLVKGNIGPGCLSMAAAASKAGSATSIVLGLLIVCIGLAGWHMIWQCKVHTQARGVRTFGDVGAAAYGRAGRDVTELFVVFVQLSVCCVFFSFFATTIHATLPAHVAGWFKPALIMLLGLPLFLYLGSLKDLKVLVPLSAAAWVALMSGFVVVLYYCAEWVADGNPRAPLQPSLEGAALFFGTAVYALEGVALLLPIENAMSAATRGQFGAVMNWSMAVIVVTFLLVTVLPLLTFGDVQSGSLAAELSVHYGGEALVTVCNLLLVLNVALTYPLQFVPCYQVIEQWVVAAAKEQLGGDRAQLIGVGDQSSLAAAPAALANPMGERAESGGSAAAAAAGDAAGDGTMAPACLRKCPCSPSPRAFRHLLEYPYLRCYLVVFSMVVAALVPNLGLLISLFGSIASSTLGLVLPPLFYLKLVPGQTASSTIGCYLIAFFGVVGAIAGFVSSMQGIVQEYSD